MTSCPLVVDLDGTLIQSDMLHESALHALRDRPLDVLSIPLWLMQGKAQMKERLAAGFEVVPQALPYNPALMQWLQEQYRGGRRLVLCTASDSRIAEAIARHLGIFAEVIASDGRTNLAGPNKARALEARFGVHGFDYAGNSRADLAVWRSARRAIVVGAEALASAARRVCEVEHIFPTQAPPLKVWLRALRLHQWLKNVLLFVPMAAAHQLRNADVWWHLLMAFLAFSLCASAVYVVNDLTDLDSDRLHPRKRHRPFACGALPAWIGVAMVPPLLLGSLALALHVGPRFLPWLLVYFVVTCAYSWGLKRLTLIDCLTLALLYTLRVIAGNEAAGLASSFWLLAFSVFLFMSLAFVKRYAELSLLTAGGKGQVHGRGYGGGDAPLVQTMGIAAGYAAVMVLALYMNSDAITKLYHAPEWVWGTVLVMLFWVSWMWLQAHRGRMHDDPILFALKDRASLVAAALFGAFLFIGKVGVAWWP